MHNPLYISGVKNWIPACAGMTSYLPFASVHPERSDAKSKDAQDKLQRSIQEKRASELYASFSHFRSFSNTNWPALSWAWMRASSCAESTICRSCGNFSR
jgi:hypothetical protein